MTSRPLVANRLQLGKDHRVDFAGELPPPVATVAADAVTIVEVVLLSPAADRLRFRIRTGLLGTAEHPDLAARRLAGLDGTPGALLHSTSWRFTRTVVLTYVGLPDPRPSPAAGYVPTTAPSGSGDPLAPAPARIRPGDVALHACRHLAYLRHTDPLVADRAAAHPHLWDLIDLFTPAVAGMLIQRP
jgi:hypothetical protein